MAWTVCLHSLTSAVAQRLNRGCWRHLLDNESTSVYLTLQLQHVWRHMTLALHHTSSPAAAAAAAVVVVWMRSISTATSSTSHQWTRRTCLCVTLVPTDRRTSTCPQQTLFDSFSATTRTQTVCLQSKVFIIPWKFISRVVHYELTFSPERQLCCLNILLLFILVGLVIFIVLNLL